MSFKSTDLSVLAYANNFTLWHYTTPDDDITVAGYFDNASDMLRVNDLIIANFDTDDTTVDGPQTKFYIVTANTGGAVTITLYS